MPLCYPACGMSGLDADLKLFSDGLRSDPSPAGYAEADFTFLDRVAQPYWERIRAELDRWFEAFPRGEVARDLRNRFRKADPGQHYAAWWELYLHRLFTLAGYEVEVHPRLDGTTDRPDFRISSGDQSVLVEAATTFSGIDDGEEHSALEPKFLDAVNKGKHDNFTVMLEFVEIGTVMPSTREIVGPILQWLDTLDPDLAYDAENVPRKIFRPRDWSLEITAFATAREYRGEPTRLLAGGSVEAGTVDTVERLRTTVERKASKYGQLREPFVIAVLLPSTFADRDSIEKALFGDTAVEYFMNERGNERWIRVPNGVWTRGSRRGPQMSGLITGTRIMPGEAVARTWPRFWPNPHALRPVDLDLPLPRSVGSAAAQFVHDDDGEPPRSFFGLEDGWPGPEDPFVDLD